MTVTAQKMAEVTATGKHELGRIVAAVERASGAVIDPDLWPSFYREHSRNAGLLLREYRGMPPGPLADAMLDGAIALKGMARDAFAHAFRAGQLLRCYT